MPTDCSGTAARSRASETEGGNACCARAEAVTPPKHKQEKRMETTGKERKKCMSVRGSEQTQLLHGPWHSCRTVTTCQRLLHTVMQHLCHGSRRQRLAEIISLHQVTAMLPQIFQLLSRFHSLGNHFQAQAMGQRNNGADYGCIIRISRDVIHKRTINFQHIDRETLEITQTRISGTKLVDR